MLLELSNFCNTDLLPSMGLTGADIGTYPGPPNSPGISRLRSVSFLIFDGFLTSIFPAAVLLRRIGVLRGLTNGLTVVLEHFECTPLGDWGPGEMGVKLKFFLRVLGLGGTVSSGAGVSKLTRRLMFVKMLGKLGWCRMGVT